ncbi:hypothetical protein CEXT_561601 [Caerostris extrusa]|uniref:Uncharacterized protein n=1 Tax=Caerostris extrusa TaxID=172846 RepID=A0AAV4WPF6_CAEEX|nr:hypothetical protein CEXT_561601 [Caerostris extrusa]
MCNSKVKLNQLQQKTCFRKIFFSSLLNGDRASRQTKASRSGRSSENRVNVALPNGVTQCATDDNGPLTAFAHSLQRHGQHSKKKKL